MTNSTFFSDRKSLPRDTPLPSASIIVPVWNGEKMLPTCLKSVLNQDFDPSEIIIVDDGSTDKSLDVVKNVVNGRKNVRIIHHSTNLGLGRTLNEGIKEANGEYVQIVHQDCEIIDNNYLSKCVASLEANPQVAAITGQRIYQLERFSPNEKLFMVANGHLSEMNYGEHETEELTFTEHKCDLFRKSAVENIGGFPDAHFRSSGEDQVLSSDLRDKGYTLVKLGSIRYNLGFGRKELTLKGIFEKVFQYGKTQAGVLVSRRSSIFKGVSKNKALSGRAMNRLQMIISASAIVAGLLLSTISPYFILLSLATVGLRLYTYSSGLNKIRGKLRLAAVGPLLDFTYSIGFLEGILVRGLGRQV
jgi:glycosyltransferase involved in cell wall biosynthesis